MSNQIKKSLVPTVGDIPPQSIAAAGSADSSFVAVSQAPAFIARANLGALGGGTVAFKLEQATDSGGTGVKALKTVGSSAVNDANIEGEFEASEMDLAGGFTHVRMTLEVTGGTGALCAAILEAASPRYAA